MASKPSGKAGRSPARTPYAANQAGQKAKGYTSDGVRDNDVLKMPGSDWQLLGVLTVVAAIVRLFRIYQPTSVVFDEVQYATLAT